MYDASLFVNVSEPLRLGNLTHFYQDAFKLKDDMFRARVCISGYRYQYIYIAARCSSRCTEIACYTRLKLEQVYRRIAGDLVTLVI